MFSQIQRLRDPEYTAPRPQWWVYDLIVLFSLFAIQAYASLKSFREVWLEIAEDVFINTVPGNYLPENIVETTPLSSPGLNAPLRRFRINDERWTSRTTAVYIAIVLYVAVTGFLSLSLPKPPLHRIHQVGYALRRGLLPGQILGLDR